MKNRHSKNHAPVLIIVLVLLVAMSAVFLLLGFGASAADDELDAAITAESQAKQALDAAKAEAERLESSKERLSDEALEELIQKALTNAQAMVDEGLRQDADDYIAEIILIFGDAQNDAYDRYNDSAAVAERWTTAVDMRVDDLQTLVTGLFDEYITAFADTGVDCTLALEVMLDKVDDQRYLVNNAIIGFLNDINESFLNDPENEDVYSAPGMSASEINLLAKAVYDAIDKVQLNLKASINDLPNWVEYCIDSAIHDLHIPELDETWHESFVNLIRIKRETLGLDYSVLMKQDYYYIGSGEDVVVSINGDINAVDNLLYFNIYRPFWSDDANDYLLAGQPMVRNADFTVSGGEFGDIILTVKSKYLDKLKTGSQLLSLYYIEDEELKWTNFYIEMMAEEIEPEDDEIEEEFPAQPVNDSAHDNNSSSDSNSALSSNPIPDQLPAASPESDADLVMQRASNLTSEGGNTSINWFILVGIILAASAVITGILLLILRRKKSASEE